VHQREQGWPSRRIALANVKINAISWKWNGGPRGKGGARRKILFAAKTGAHILKKDVGDGLTAKASRWWLRDEDARGRRAEEAKSASALVLEELAKISKA